MTLAIIIPENPVVELIGERLCRRYGADPSCAISRGNGGTELLKKQKKNKGSPRSENDAR